jgi:hypothetical protein
MNQTQTMNDLALLAIGAGGGLCIALIACMVYLLHRTTSSFRAAVSASLANCAQQLAANRLAADHLRADLTAALSRLDSERLFAASLQLQRLVKSFSIQVDTMQRALFAQPASPALDFSQAGMSAGLAGTELDEEAVDDARMLAERNRWAVGAASQPLNQPAADPLANLSEEDKQRRVLEYFERRRAQTAGFPYPYPSNLPSSGSVPSSTPPVAGSGIYSSLLDEASQIPRPSHPLPDFSGMEPEEGVELVDKGELT